MQVKPMCMLEEMPCEILTRILKYACTRTRPCGNVLGAGLDLNDHTSLIIDVFVSVARTSRVLRGVVKQFSSYVLTKAYMAFHLADLESTIRFASLVAQLSPPVLSSYSSSSSSSSSMDTDDVPPPPLANTALILSTIAWIDVGRYDMARRDCNAATENVNAIFARCQEQTAVRSTSPSPSSPVVTFFKISDDMLARASAERRELRILRRIIDDMPLMRLRSFTLNAVSQLVARGLIEDPRVHADACECPYDYDDMDTNTTATTTTTPPPPVCCNQLRAFGRGPVTLIASRSMILSDRLREYLERLIVVEPEDEVPLRLLQHDVLRECIAMLKINPRPINTDIFTIIHECGRTRHDRVFALLQQFDTTFPLMPSKIESLSRVMLIDERATSAVAAALDKCAARMSRSRQVVATRAFHNNTDRIHAVADEIRESPRRRHPLAFEFREYYRYVRCVRMAFKYSTTAYMILGQFLSAKVHYDVFNRNTHTLAQLAPHVDTLAVVHIDRPIVINVNAVDNLLQQQQQQQQQGHLLLPPPVVHGPLAGLAGEGREEEEEEEEDEADVQQILNVYCEAHKPYYEDDEAENGMATVMTDGFFWNNSSSSNNNNHLTRSRPSLSPYRIDVRLLRPEVGEMVASAWASSDLSVGLSSARANSLPLNTDEQIYVGATLGLFLFRSMNSIQRVNFFKFLRLGASSYAPRHRTLEQLLQCFDSHVYQFREGAVAIAPPPPLAAVMRRVEEDDDDDDDNDAVIVISDGDEDEGEEDDGDSGDDGEDEQEEEQASAYGDE